MQLNVESDKLLEILMDFHRVTHMRVSLYGSDCRKLLSYPQQSNPFCALMHRPETNGACAASNNRAFRTCIRTQSTHIYTCHAGLTEVMVPLIDGGAILGYVVLGQATTLEPPALLEVLRASAARYGFDPALCAPWPDVIPRRTPAEVQSMAKLLEACAYYMIYNDFIHLHKNTFVQNLDAYLDEHLAEKITVEELCRAFGLGRTTFYDRVRASLNTGIHQYLCQKRVAKARALLAETALSPADIALRSGFQEPGYFSRVFRQQTGFTPRQYREKVGTGV